MTLDQRERIIELAAECRRFDDRRLHIPLRRESWQFNHKTVHRIYREEILQARKRKRKRIGPAYRQPIELSGRVDERWSMDFIYNVLSRYIMYCLAAPGSAPSI